MTEAVCLAAVLVLGVILYLEKRQAREREREWSLERGALLQRIQAPEIAVRQFADRREREPVQPVPVDDDRAFAEAKERRLNASGD